jgi:hypothetical protein
MGSVMYTFSFLGQSLRWANLPWGQLVTEVQDLEKQRAELSMQKKHLGISGSELTLPTGRELRELRQALRQLQSAVTQHLTQLTGAAEPGFTEAQLHSCRLQSELIQLLSHLEAQRRVLVKAGRVLQRRRHLADLPY